jgi:hypothetical protein
LRRRGEASYRHDKIRIAISRPIFMPTHGLPMAGGSSINRKLRDLAVSFGPNDEGAMGVIEAAFDGQRCARRERRGDRSKIARNGNRHRRT